MAINLNPLHLGLVAGKIAISDVLMYREIRVAYSDRTKIIANGGATVIVSFTGRP
jgi:hypothetical protein